MAPKIQVPCDFGREYINVPEHSNLKLKLKNGGDYLVNSVIMCYNSPEIKRLTSELHQTSLEMDDFGEDAVYCFVDALYSGELEMIDKDIFTDVYKMGRVFNVSWLLAKCSEYFENAVSCRPTINSTVEGQDYAYEKTKCLFVLAGTIHNQDFLKEHIFLDFLVKSFSEKGDKREFIKRLVGEIKLDELSESLAEQILHVVGKESDILVDGLLRSLKVHSFETSLSKEFKFMLKSCDLSMCYQKNPATYYELFELFDDIDSLTKEDLKFINRINRQCMKKACDIQPTASRPGEPSTTSRPGEPSTSSRPGEPSTVSKPGEPSAASKPGGPSTASRPGQPSTASKPGGPSTAPSPGQPSTTSRRMPGKNAQLRSSSTSKSGEPSSLSKLDGSSPASKVNRQESRHDKVVYISGEPRIVTEFSEPLDFSALSKCYLCDEHGHFARDCRQRQAYCYNCNDTPNIHLKKDCPILKFRAQIRRTKLKLECVICGGRGHKDRNCARYHGFVKLENDVCEICREKGHSEKDCVF